VKNNITGLLQILSLVDENNHPSCQTKVARLIGMYQSINQTELCLQSYVTEFCAIERLPDLLRYFQIPLSNVDYSGLHSDSVPYTRQGGLLRRGGGRGGWGHGWAFSGDSAARMAVFS